EDPVEVLPGQDVLELGPDERTALAGLDVLELEFCPQLAALELEDECALQDVRCRHVGSPACGSPQRMNSSLVVSPRSSLPSSRVTSVSSMRTPPLPGR